MNFIESNAVIDIANLTYTMWEMGWDEKNGGNISYILDEKEISLIKKPIETRFYPLENIPENMVGKFILITSSGSNFRLVKQDILRCLGVIKITKTGYEIVWGFEENNKPTSELYMHLLSHSERLKVDSTHRVVVHNHATDILAMTFIHELDEKKFTRTLWGIITECILVFPDGVSIVPWMVCGTEKIGQSTAEKLKDSRIVVWAHHGILATGNSLMDAFGLIETVNKAASIYVKTYPHMISKGITDNQLKDVCQFFKVTPKNGIID